MKKSKKFALLTGAVVGATAIAARVMKKKAEKTTYEADLIEPIEKRKMGFYEKYGKRILDIACATAAIVVFSPLYLGVAALVKLKLGSPVLFTQDRPGLIGKDGKETVFNITPSILGTVASSAAIALFGIVATIEGYTYTITTAINGMFMPKISRIYERGGEKDELMPLMLSVGKFQYAINGLIVAGFAVVGKEFINLWMGPTYLDAYYGILLVIIPGLFFNSMQIANTAMIVRKKVNLQAWVNLGMGMVNVLLSIILSSYFGVIGACISISIAYMLRAVVLLFIYKRVLKIDMASFVVNCYFRMGIPIIITIMLRFLMNSLLPNGGWLVLAAKGVVIVGIYAVVTLLLGLNSEERNKLLRRKV